MRGFFYARLSGAQRVTQRGSSHISAMSAAVTAQFPPSPRLRRCMLAAASGDALLAVENDPLTFVGPHKNREGFEVRVVDFVHAGSVGRLSDNVV